MRSKYEFFAERANFDRYIALNMAERLPAGLVYGDEGAPLLRKVATSINFTGVDPDLMGTATETPLLRLSRSDAENLMDQLWHCGIRPSNGTGSTGQLAATETHLADMRKISFDLLAKVQP